MSCQTVNALARDLMFLIRRKKQTPNCQKLSQNLKALSQPLKNTKIQTFFAFDGQNNYRDFRYFADFAAKFDAVHFGHLKIGNYQIRVKIVKKINRAFAVGRSSHIIAMRLQTALQNARDLIFVINHQDFSRIHI